MVAPLTIRLFGPIGILVEGRPLPRTRSRKSLWIIALLALRNGRPAAREWLAGMLWPDAHASVALANLRPIVSELRRAMGDQGYRLQTPDRKNICLDIVGADVDAVAFDEAFAAGSLAKAVDLYRGPLLEDCTEFWVPPERESREQNCLFALETLSLSASQAGNFSEAVALRQRCVAIAPGLDSHRRALMEALAQSGDLNGALQVYRDFAQTLKTESQRSPEPETNELYIELRTRGRKKTVGRSSSDPKPTGYLPYSLTELIGREDERAEVSQLLLRSRLVTLTGLGGIGKTRLAREVAAELAGEFSGGVWFVPLEAARSGDSILRHLSETFGLPERLGQDVKRALDDFLEARSLLLVLDNCEHLLPAVGVVCERLLRSFGRLRILATSREPLGIVDEAVYPVPGLTTPDMAALPAQGTTLLRMLMGYESVRLFLERAQAVNDRFELTRTNGRAVATVLSKLDGIPLAIELAAALIRSMTPEEIAEQLETRRFNLLAGNRRGVVPRQKTLRATLDWSFELLDERERFLLPRLSVFSGGWPLEAAEAFASDGVTETLRSLSEKSLIVHETDGDGGRYRMLETVRQYAGEKLSDTVRMDLRRKHRNFYADLSREAYHGVLGPEQTAWTLRVAQEIENFRAALDGCEEEPEAGVRICNGLWAYWYRRGCFEEGRRSFERALARAEPLPVTAQTSTALSNAAAFAHEQGDHPKARRLLQEALRICEEVGDRKTLARRHHNLGVVCMAEGAYLQARANFERNIELEDSFEKPDIAATLVNLGLLSFKLGDFSRSQECCEKALGLNRRAGIQDPIAVALGALGRVACAVGDYPLARERLEASLGIFTALENPDGQAKTLQLLGGLEYALGRYETAGDLYRESYRTFLSQGQTLQASMVACELGLAALGAGELAQARRLIEESLSVALSIQHRPGIAQAECGLGALLLAEGAWARAEESLRRSIQLYSELGQKGDLAVAISYLAEALFHGGAVTEAIRIGSASETLRRSLGAAFPLYIAERGKANLERAAQEAGPEAFGTAWKVGDSALAEDDKSAALAALLSPTLPNGENSVPDVQELRHIA